MSRRGDINLVEGEKSATCRAGGLLLTEWPFNNYSNASLIQQKALSINQHPDLVNLLILLRFD